MERGGENSKTKKPPLVKAPKKVTIFQGRRVEKVAVFLLLRATLQKLKFLMASYMSDADDFGDVTFIDEETDQTYLFAVEHEDKDFVAEVDHNHLFPNEIYKREVGNFSLYRCLKSYSVINSVMPGNNNYIIYTNHPLSKDCEKTKQECVKLPNFLSKLVGQENGIRLTPKNDKVVRELQRFVNKTLSEKLSIKDIYTFFENFTFISKPEDTDEIIKIEFEQYLQVRIPPRWMKGNLIHLSHMCFHNFKKQLSEKDDKNTKKFITLTKAQETLETLDQQLRVLWNGNLINIYCCKK